METVLKLLAHCIFLNIALVGAFFARFSLAVPEYNFQAYLKIWPFVTGIQILIFYFSGLYDRQKKMTHVDSLYAVLNSVTIGFILLASVTFYLRGFSFPRTVIILAWFFSITAIGIFQSALIVYSQRTLKKKNILIIGHCIEGKDVADDIRQFVPDKFHICGFIDRSRGEIKEEFLGSIADFKNVIKEYSAEICIVVTRGLSTDEIIDLIFKAEEAGVELKILPGLYETMIGKVQMAEIAGIPFMEINLQKIYGPRWVLKRFIDIVVSFLGIVFLSPVFAAAVCAIKFESSGPAIFSQERLGAKKRKFRIFKFRSMVQDAEAITGPVWADKNDSRITRVGRFIRKYRIDELPQLFNVLAGDMSLVGPRPEREVFVEKFSNDIPFFEKRMMVKPGITGLAQIHGRYNTRPDYKLRYDLIYIANFSILLDIKIMVLTLKVVFSGEGSH